MYKSALYADHWSIMHIESVRSAYLEEARRNLADLDAERERLAGSIAHYEKRPTHVAP